VGSAEEIDPEEDEDPEASFEEVQNRTARRIAESTGMTEETVRALLVRSRGGLGQKEQAPQKRSRKAKGQPKALVQRAGGRQLRRTTIYFEVELAATWRSSAR